VGGKRMKEAVSNTKWMQKVTYSSALLFRGLGVEGAQRKREVNPYISPEQD